MPNATIRLARHRRSAPIELLEGRLFLSAAPLLVANVDETSNLAQIHEFAALAPAVATVAAPSTPILAPASESGVKNATNVVKPTFTGTAAAGAVVTVFSGTSALGKATATSAGAYAVTSSVALSNGMHAITAQASENGITSPISGTLTITILTAAPAAPSAPALKSLAGNVATVDGTAQAQTTVEIFANGKVVGSAWDASGTYVVTTSALANGGDSITADATDLADNVSKMSGALTLTIGAIATKPAAPSTPILAAASESGVKGYTNVVKPTFTGTALAGSTVTILTGTAVLGSAIASPNGVYSVTIAVALSAGAHAITATATNAAETSPVSGELSITILTTPPAAPSTPVLKTLSNGVATFAGTAGAQTTVEIFANGKLVGSAWDSSGAYLITTSTLANGGYSITANATDLADNASVLSGALALTVGVVTQPAAPSTPAIVSATTLTPTFTGTAAAGDTVTIYADNKAVGSGVAVNGTYSITVSALTAGSHSIYATANAGNNVSAKSAAVTVVLGTLASPRIVYSYVTDQSTYTVAPDGTVAVEVFLKETLIGGASSLIVADGGLLGAGFSVTRAQTAPAGAATLTGIAGSVTSNGSNFAGGVFSPSKNNSTSFQAGDNAVNISAASGPVTDAKDAGGITDEIEIGTVTIMAGASGTTQFTLANFRFPATTGGYTQTFNNGYDLDVTQTTGSHIYTGAAADPETFDVTVS